MNEIWKDITGYEELYQVSNYGRVRSLKTLKRKVLKPVKTSNGYYCVTLYKNGTKVLKKVHRLVAEAFIPNHYNLPQVNHKDEDKSNNIVDNLEWCDSKMNNRYGTRLKRISVKLSRPVVQCLKDGRQFIFWLNAKQIKHSVFKVDNSNIGKCLKGKLNMAGGYIWRIPTKDEMKYIDNHKEKMLTVF